MCQEDSDSVVLWVKDEVEAKVFGCVWSGDDDTNCETSQKVRSKEL